MGDIICEYCGEPLQAKISPEKARALLAEAREQLRDALNQPGFEESQSKLRGLPVDMTLIGFGIITAAALTGLPFGMSDRGGGLLVVVLFLLFIFGGLFIVHLRKCILAYHINFAPTPEKAMRRWIMALSMKHFEKAWAGVAPIGRVTSQTEKTEISAGLPK